jgi:hypothetical protein
MSVLRRSTVFVKLKERNFFCRRCLATTSSSAPFQVFNTETKRRQRNRAATLDPETCRRTDYLRDEVASRLIERFMVLDPQFTHYLSLSQWTTVDNSLLIGDLKLSWISVLDQDIWQRP